MPGTILITGSEGLIGTALCAALLEAKWQVRRFDLKLASWDAALDVADPQKLRAAVAGCAGIVHLAAVSRVVFGEQHPELCWRTNVEGTRNVLAAACAEKTRPWVLFTSSREVYGQAATLPVTEHAPILPMNVYGRSKAAAEQLCMAARKDGIRTAVVRLSNVYGSARDHADRVVPCFAARAVQGLPLRVDGSSHCFDFTHVVDTVAGLCSIIDVLHSGERALPPIHLVTGRSTTLYQLARQASAAAGGRSALVEATPRSFDVARFYGDPQRAESLLGWRAQIRLRDGLVRLVGEFARALSVPLDEPLSCL